MGIVIRVPVKVPTKVEVKVPIKVQTKITVKVSSTPVESEEESCGLLYGRKEKPKPEFIVSDEYGNFFCGYRHAYPYWCDKISEAKELSEPTHFQALVRWHKYKKLKQEFL
jgi:hypothetical protein